MQLGQDIGKRAAVGLLLALLAMPAVGQRRPVVTRHDVPMMYRDARMKLVLSDIFANGMRIPALRPEPMPTRFDSVLAWMQTKYPGYVAYVPPVPPLRAERWKLIERGQRFRHSKQFNAVEWAFLGNNHFTALDTAFTRDIRARMQGAFGAPTKTLAEIDWSRNLKREEYIQFEYWFIVNDSIPVMVMDVNGPFDRGVVMATDQRYRDEMQQLRRSFLEPIMEGGRRAPYVDYYYSYRRKRWFRTGFDGREFFTDPIGQPNMARGRPRLGTQGG